MVCSMDFYTNCFTVNVMSMHPIPPLSPHLNSGNSHSSTFCDLSWIILVAVFPTTSIKAIATSPVITAFEATLLWYGNYSSYDINPCFWNLPFFHTNERNYYHGDEFLILTSIFNTFSKIFKLPWTFSLLIPSTTPCYVDASPNEPSTSPSLIMCSSRLA